MLPIVIVALVVITIFAVLAVQFLSTIYLGTVRNTTVGEVTDNSVTLTWDKVNSANGYHVYQQSEESDSYMQVASTDENPSYTVTDLKQATVYNFYVKAFNGNNESEEYIPLEGVCTLPEKEEIVSIISDKAGSVLIEWKQNSDADGYIVEYHAAGADYSPGNQIVIENPEKTSTRLTDLEVNKEISVRVSAFCNGDPKIVGQPSDEKVHTVWDGKSELPGQKTENKNDNNGGQSQTPATTPAQSETDNNSAASDQYADSSADIYSGDDYAAVGDYSGDSVYGADGVYGDGAVYGDGVVGYDDLGAGGYGIY